MKKKGFTLIELLVFIIILEIIAVSTINGKVNKEPLKWIPCYVTKHGVEVKISLDFV